MGISGFLSVLYRNLPHPAMAHHAPTLCWQSPENQSVMLPNSTIESVITVGSSNTQIPQTQRLFQPAPTISVFLFSQKLFLGWTSPSRALNPGAFPGASLAKWCLRRLQKFSKKNNGSENVEIVAVPIWIRVWLVSNVGLSRCFNRNDKMDLWWTRQTKSIPC